MIKFFSNRIATKQRLKEDVSFRTDPNGEGLVIYYDDEKVGKIIDMTSCVAWMVIPGEEKKVREIISNPPILDAILDSIAQVARSFHRSKIIIGKKVGGIGSWLDEGTWAEHGFIIGHHEDVPREFTTTFFQRFLNEEA